MSWRQFKEQPEGFKGLKGFKGVESEGLKPLRPLKPAEEEMKSITAIEGETPASPEQPTPCYCCHGQDFWLSIHGVTICRHCHPPAQGAEKVATIKPTATTEEGLMQLVRDTYAELDKLRDWTGYRAAMTEEQRQRVTEVEARIDLTYGALDREGLAAALADYRETLTDKPPNLKPKEYRK